MKYIDANKIKAEIDKITESLTKSCNPDPLGTTEECMAAAEIEVLGLVKEAVDSLQQDRVSIEKQITEKFARIVRGHLYELTAGFNTEFEKTYLEVTGEKMYKGYTD